MSSNSGVAGDRRCVALLYHHVGQAIPGAYRDLTVSPAEFEGQIRWLARHGYNGIRPADWLAWQKSGVELPRKPVLITFDDAYSDIAEHALPVLRRYGFGAAVFAVTARMGESSDWDKSMGYPTLPLMSGAQIRYWADQGIEFGSHSRTHPNLTQLSRDALRGEMVRSREELEALLGRPVIAFAYPFGAWDDAAHEMARSSFNLAFGAASGFNCRDTDAHLLRRIVVKPNQPLWEFSLLVRLGDHWRSKLALRTRLKRALGLAPRAQ